MTARKRTDSEEPVERAADAPPYTHGGLGIVLAREIAIDARRARARSEFFRIEHAESRQSPVASRQSTDHNSALSTQHSALPKFLGLYRVTGSNDRVYDVLIRDPDPEHRVNRC